MRKLHSDYCNDFNRKSIWWMKAFVERETGDHSSDSLRERTFNSIVEQLCCQSPGTRNTFGLCVLKELGNEECQKLSQCDIWILYFLFKRDLTFRRMYGLFPTTPSVSPSQWNHQIEVFGFCLLQMTSATQCQLDWAFELGWVTHYILFLH